MIDTLKIHLPISWICIIELTIPQTEWLHLSALTMFHWMQCNESNYVVFVFGCVISGETCVLCACSPSRLTNKYGIGNGLHTHCRRNRVVCNSRPNIELQHEMDVQQTNNKNVSGFDVMATWTILAKWRRRHCPSVHRSLSIRPWTVYHAHSLSIRVSCPKWI